MDHDQVIAERFHAGDLEALEVIIDRYQTRLYRMGLKLMQDAVEAADFCQDAFLHAFEKREQFNPARPFQPWFFKLALNVGRMRLRKRREIPMGDAFPEQSSTAEGEARLIMEEDKGLVRLALKQLSPKHYESLILRFDAELSLNEIARVLGISLGTVKSRLNRGLIQFKMAYESLGGDRP